MEKKKIRMFATDLDGTLFSGWAKVSQRAADDLRNMRRSGIIVVLCTGRPFYSVRRNVPDDIYDYAICTNGQDIYDSRTKTHIYGSVLEKEDMELLCTLMEKYPMVMEAVWDDQTHHFASMLYRPFLTAARKAGTLYKRLQGKYYSFTEISSHREELTSRTFGKVCFASFHFVLAKAQSRLDPRRYSAFYTNPMWIEIMRADVSKGSALRSVMEKENISPADSACAGDGENDLPMMQECAVRIAMANAMPSVRKHATDVCGHCRKDGLAQWLEEHIDFMQE